MGITNQGKGAGRAAGLPETPTRVASRSLTARPQLSPQPKPAAGRSDRIWTAAAATVPFTPSAGAGTRLVSCAARFPNTALAAAATTIPPTPRIPPASFSPTAMTTAPAQRPHTSTHTFLLAHTHLLRCRARDATARGSGGNRLVPSYVPSVRSVAPSDQQQWLPVGSVCAGLVGRQTNGCEGRGDGRRNRGG